MGAAPCCCKAGARASDMKDPVATSVVLDENLPAVGAMLDAALKHPFASMASPMIFDLQISPGGDLGVIFLDVEDADGSVLLVEKLMPESPLAGRLLEEQSEKKEHGGDEKPQKCGGGKGLVLGDMVEAVAGAQGTVAELRAALQSAANLGHLRLQVRPRPDSFEASLPAASATNRLGLYMVIYHGRIHVRDVRKSGLVQEWNQDHPRCTVQAGDIVTHVNGISKQAMDMYTEMQAFVTDQVPMRITVAPPKRVI